MIYELSPAYGRDYKSANEVKQAFLTGKDFEGDYSLRFMLVNVNDIPKPCTVQLRYKRQTMVTTLEIKAGQVAQPESTAKPKTSKPPSIATMERWMMDGVAKATDGCPVEPDGHCPHGKPSWLLKMGVI